MYEIRFHGRGGQGAVMAAQVLAEAAVREGYEAHAFPYFGAERRGAPVEAYARIDDQKIRIKSQIYEPDFVIILDESLMDLEPLAKGLKPGGKVAVNSPKPPEEIDLGEGVEAIRWTPTPCHEILKVHRELMWACKIRHCRGCITNFHRRGSWRTRSGRAGGGWRRVVARGGFRGYASRTCLAGGRVLCLADMN